MGIVNTIIQGAIALIGLLVGGEAGYIIKKMIDAAKDRINAANVSIDGHKDTHEKLEQLQAGQDEIISLLKTQLAAALADNSYLRAENAALRGDAFEEFPSDEEMDEILYQWREKRRAEKFSKTKPRAVQ